MLELVQALNSLILHDFAGSVGAIVNSVSLLEDKDELIQKKAKSLLDYESDAFITRVKFFRNCYGIAQSSNVDQPFLAKILSDFLISKDITLKMDKPKKELVIEPFIAQAIMCLVYIVSKNLTKNNSLEIVLKNGVDNFLAKVIFVDDNLIRKNGIFFPNAKDGQKTDVYNVTEHYLNVLCKHVGCKCILEIKNNIFEYSLVKVNVKQ